MIKSLIMLSSLSRRNVEDFLTILLKSTGKSAPNDLSIGVITTAWDYSYFRFFKKPERQLLVENGIVVAEIDLRHISPEELRIKIENVDAIFIECGNTFALKHWSDKTDLLQVMRATRRNLVLIGSSAGAIIAGTSIKIAALCSCLDDLPLLGADDIGWGLVDKVVWPHYTSFSKFLEMICGMISRQLLGNHVLRLLPDEIVVHESISEGEPQKE